MSLYIQLFGVLMAKVFFGQFLRYCLLALFLISFGHTFGYTGSFRHECISSGFMYNENKICYYLDGQEIGFLSYTKMPLFSFYILHTLYVHPQYRNNGYGKYILEYACSCLKKLGASRLYIQPGPFEINEDGYLVTALASYDGRLESLIEFYRKSGFIFASKLLACSAYFLYKCVGIDENAQYLMVKTLD